MKDHRTTLLVFTLGARHESRRRRLLPASLGRVERRLHQTCLDATLAAGRNADCRLEVSAPLALELPVDVRRRPQRGPDFGARLRAALGECFRESNGPVVLVGSDVPDLGAEHLRATRSALAEDPERVVVGPSPDGGFYLLAAARPLDEVLAQVCWCSRGTLESLERALAAAGRPVFHLALLADLDRRADLERWLADPAGIPRHDAWHQAWHCLRAELLRLLALLRRPGPEHSQPAARLPRAWLPSRRGPPLPAAL